MRREKIKWKEKVDEEKVERKKRKRRRSKRKRTRGSGRRGRGTKARQKIKWRKKKRKRKWGKRDRRQDGKKKNMKITMEKITEKRAFPPLSLVETDPWEMADFPVGHKKLKWRTSLMPPFRGVKCRDLIPLDSSSSSYTTSTTTVCSSSSTSYWRMVMAIIKSRWPNNFCSPFQFSFFLGYSQSLSYESDVIFRVVQK